MIEIDETARLVRTTTFLPQLEVTRRKRVPLSLDSREAKDADDAGVLNKSTIAFALPEDEHFFGLGERFVSVDHRGYSLYSYAEEGGLGLGEDVEPNPENPLPNGPSMTYFPVPFFLSSKGYGVHLDTTYRTEVHLGSERSDGWRAAPTRNSTPPCTSSDPLAIIDSFTEDTGRPDRTAALVCSALAGASAAARWSVTRPSTEDARRAHHRHRCG